MKTAIAAVAMVILSALPSRAQDTQAATSGPPIQLARPDAPTASPAVITLADALQRAKQNDTTFLSSAADAESAREDRVQARASLLPTITKPRSFSATHRRRTTSFPTDASSRSTA